MKVAIYARVSTVDQNYEGQLEELRALADRSGWEVVEVYSEKVSGTKETEDRPELKRMMRDARWRKFEKVSLRKIQMEQRILREISGDDYADTVAKVILDKDAERAQVLVDLGTFRQEMKWIDWVGDFESHIDYLVHGEWSVEDKQRFLNGVIDKISMVCVDKTTHRFDIEFNLPYDGSSIVYKSGRSGPYDVVMGEKVVSVKIPDSAAASKKKIED